MCSELRKFQNVRNSKNYCKLQDLYIFESLYLYMFYRFNILYMLYLLLRATEPNQYGTVNILCTLTIFIVWCHSPASFTYLHIQVVGWYSRAHRITGMHLFLSSQLHYFLNRSTIIRRLAVAYRADDIYIYISLLARFFMPRVPRCTKRGAVQIAIQ